MKFQITGQYITDKLRILWSESPNKALKFIKESIPELPLDETINIIEGRKKLEGINDLDLVDDNWTKPDDVPSYLEFIQKAEIAINTLHDVKDDLISKLNYILYEAKVLQSSIDSVGYGFDKNNERVKDIYAMWESLPDHIKIYARNVPEFIVKHARTIKAENYKDIWSDKRALPFDNPSLYDLFNESILSVGYLSSEYISKYIATRISDESEYRKICLTMEVYEPITTDSWNIVSEYKNKLKEEERKGIEASITEEIQFSFKKIEPDKNVESIYGWVSPNGDFYGCGHARHYQLIQELCRQIMGDTYVEDHDSVQWAETNNWVRICHNDWDGKLQFQCLDVNKLKQKQLDTLFDYSTHHNKLNLFNEIISDFS